MYRCALLYTLICFCLVESKKSYTLKTSSSWKNEIKKCASGGEDYHTYYFDIGKLQNLGLEYTDIDKLTTVIAYGKISGYTKASYQELPLLLLHDYEEGDGFKKFSGGWRYEAVCGWATQRCGIKLTVHISAAGDVQLTNYVTAASWGAVSCAETKAFVNCVEIIN